MPNRQDLTQPDTLAAALALLLEHNLAVAYLQVSIGTSVLGLSQLSVAGACCKSGTFQGCALGHDE